MLVWHRRDNYARVARLEDVEEPEEVGEAPKDRDVLSSSEMGRECLDQIHQRVVEEICDKEKTYPGRDSIDDVGRSGKTDLGGVADANQEHARRLVRGAPRLCRCPRSLGTSVRMAQGKRLGENENTVEGSVFG